MLIKAKTFKLKVNPNDCEKLVKDLEDNGVNIDLVDRNPITRGDFTDSRARVYCTSDPEIYEEIQKFLENTSYTVWLIECL